MAEISIFASDMLVLVDESGFNRKNTIRTYGCGICGFPTRDHRLRHSGIKINCNCSDKVVDVHLLENSVDGETFEDFCRKCLAHFDAI